MTRAERAQWCMDQALACAANSAPQFTDESVPIGLVLADWFRDSARKLSHAAGEGDDD